MTQERGAKQSQQRTAPLVGHAKQKAEAEEAWNCLVRDLLFADEADLVGQKNIQKTLLKSLILKVRLLFVLSK